MPARHRYKCLNYDRCPSYNAQPNVTADKNPVFVAMNQQPSCPHCGCIKLEDWGEAINLMGGLSENSQNSDANFRRVADRYGLTDMNNKDGQPVKRAAASAIAGPSVSVGGIQVSMDQAASGACVHMPSMAQPMKAEINKASPQASPMMKQMTRVVAEHKGAA